MKVGFISLGCSKNLIDTEILIGKFKNKEYEIVTNEKEAEILVINTCGFIESAKEEAVNTIFEMANYKKTGKCKFLIVMGCFAQRYHSELVKEIPEVDLFLRLDEYGQMWEIIEKLITKNIIETTPSKTENKKIMELEPMPMFSGMEFLDRVVTTGTNFAYLKIGEGCSNKCTYCAIPYIRGPFVSRKQEDILEEANMLAKKGITEIIIIAQDTTKYGIDIYGKSMLPNILREITKINGIELVRFLYTYPEGIEDELIEEVANNDKIAKYFDIPIQHISSTILKRMNRNTSKEKIEALLEKIKTRIPEVVLRTSLIVGFPGETDDEFTELVEFLPNAKFDKLGAFKYSKEEGTPAAKMVNQIEDDVKEKRYNKVMEIQGQISKQKQEEKIGKTYKVLIENITFDEKFFVGRTSGDVPDIDGIVYIKNDENVKKEKLLNTYAKCKITDIETYDLIGELVQ